MKALQSPWLLLPAVFVAFFWLLDDGALYDIDEGAFAEATREMFERADFVATWLNGEPRYDKPILTYWFQALATRVFGFTEFALRLPSALAATLWVWAVWSFARGRLGEEAAWTAALTLCFSLFVLIEGRAATADALLNLFLALAFLDIWRWIEGPRRAVLLRVYLWLALGLLTKGPVAVALPLLASLIHLGSLGRLRLWWRAVRDPWGWLLLLALVVPWGVAVYRDQGWAFFQGFLLHHNLDRFSDTMEGHGGHWWYYLVAAPLVVWPFSGWLVPLARAMPRDWADSLGRFLWSWFGVVLVLFSLSGTQLPHYLLYGATPLFLLMGRHREDLGNRWLAFLPPLLLLGLLALLPEVLALAARQAHGEYQRAIFAYGADSLGWTYRLPVLAAIAGVLLLGLARHLPVWRALCLAGFFTTLAINGAFGPAFFRIYQGPVKEAGLLARELGRPTVFFESRFPSFSVYRRAVTRQGVPRPGDLALTRVDHLRDLERRLGKGRFEVIYRRGGIALIRAHE